MFCSRCFNCFWEGFCFMCCIVQVFKCQGSWNCVCLCGFISRVPLCPTEHADSYHVHVEQEQLVKFRWTLTATICNYTSQHCVPAIISFSFLLLLLCILACHLLSYHHPCGFWHLCSVWMKNSCEILFPASKCIHYLGMGVPPFQNSLQKRNLVWTVEEPPASRPSQKRELICAFHSGWLVWWTIVILHSVHCFKFLNDRASATAAGERWEASQWLCRSTGKLNLMRPPPCRCGFSVYQRGHMVNQTGNSVDSVAVLSS